MPVSLLANNFSDQYKEKEKLLRILRIHIGKKKFGKLDDKMKPESKNKEKK